MSSTLESSNQVISLFTKPLIILLIASEGAKEAADWAIERSLLKHSGPTSSEKDQPDTKKTKIGLHEDQSV